MTILEAIANSKDGQSILQMRENLRPRRRIIHAFRHIPNAHKSFNHNVRPTHDITCATKYTQKRNDRSTKPAKRPLIVSHPDRVNERENISQEIGDQPKRRTKGYPYGTQPPEELLYLTRKEVVPSCNVYRAIRA